MPPGASNQRVSGERSFGTWETRLSFQGDLGGPSPISESLIVGVRALEVDSNVYSLKKRF